MSNTNTRLFPRRILPWNLAVFVIAFPTTWLPSAPVKADEAAKPAQAAVDFDLQGFIDGQIKAGHLPVVAPPGRYRVTPHAGRHLSFKNLSDISIVADGVEMICTQTCQAISFDQCRNVSLKGLTIDYDPLPFTEGRITAMAPDKSWVEFAIIDGYPDNVMEERIEIYDPATRELRRETTGWLKEFQRIGPHAYRATKPPHYRFRADQDTEQVGDILVTNNRSGEHIGGHAIVSVGCTNLRLEGVALYASNCFGFLEERCDGSTYLQCKIDRRAPSDDPVKRGFPRMRSLDADAFHSNGAVKGPAIIGCTAKFQGDDCVNIHGNYHMTTACNGNRLRVAATGRMTIEAGDPVEFLPFAGERPADAACTKVEPDGPITDAEIAFIKKVSMHPESKERLLTGKAKFYTVTLDHSVELPMGSAICSGNRVGNGFVVKDCDFGYNRSRGILIKASRGEVANNKITHGWMAAVLVSPEYWWLEAASSSDVVIANNTIVGCRRAAIEVVAPGGNGKPLPAGAHRNISIVSNTITDSPWPNVRVTSVDGLLLKENHLTEKEPTDMVPPITEPWRWGKQTPAALSIEFSREVEPSK